MSEPLRKLIIPSTNAIYFIPLDEVTIIESYQNYTKVYVSNNQMILSTLKLAEFEERLNSNSFFRSHRSYIINLKHMKSFLFEGSIVMNNQQIIPVSRRKRSQLKEQVEKSFYTLHEPVRYDNLRSLTSMVF